MFPNDKDAKESPEFGQQGPPFAGGLFGSGAHNSQVSGGFGQASGVGLFGAQAPQEPQASGGLFFGGQVPQEATAYGGFAFDAQAAQEATSSGGLAFGAQTSGGLSFGGLAPQEATTSGGFGFGGGTARDAPTPGEKSIFGEKVSAKDVAPVENDDQKDGTVSKPQDLQTSGGFSFGTQAPQEATSFGGLSFGVQAAQEATASGGFSFGAQAPLEATVSGGLAVGVQAFGAQAPQEATASGGFGFGGGAAQHASTPEEKSAPKDLPGKVPSPFTLGEKCAAKEAAAVGNDTKDVTAGETEVGAPTETKAKDETLDESLDEETTWQCVTCGVENDGEDKNCASCGKRNPAVPIVTLKDKLENILAGLRIQHSTR